MESLGAALETSGHSLDMESNDFDMPRARIAEASESKVLFATDRRTLQPDLVGRPTSLRNCPASFSALLRLWRYEAGLTLKDVAGAVGVSKPTVWSWEKGKARPGRDKWHALAMALGVAPDVLASAAKNSALANVISSDPEFEGHDRDALIAQGRAMIAKAYNVTSSAVRILVEV
jgi:transcriptional regulator with XRE-family HTH domain